MRIIPTLLVLLLVPHVVFALSLMYPADGAANIEVDSYFQWQEVGAAAKYVLDVDKFTQSEDNIPPAKCSGGICTFSFLDLTAGTIQYLSSYTWGVTAVNAIGNPVGGPSGSRTFTTKSAPVGPPPPGPGGGGTPSTLGNPISANNITELFNAIFSLLFGLSIFIIPIIVIYAAFLMLMGGGDPVKLAKGRMILMWTAIAFILILIARGLPVVFRNLL